MQLAVTLTGDNDMEFERYQELLDELDITMIDENSDGIDHSQVHHLSIALEEYLNKLSKEDITNE
jgi:hypothetical protein